LRVGVRTLATPGHSNIADASLFLSVTIKAIWSLEVKG